MPHEEASDRDVERRLARLLAIWRALETTRRRKAAAADRLPFPHAAPRPIQEKLIEAVATAVNQGENLIAEARQLLTVPPTVSQNLTHFTTDPRPILEHRDKVARMIERLRQY